MRQRLTPEAKLANYWRKRTGLSWSDFDVFQGKTPPAGTSCRSPYWVLDAVANLTKPVNELIREIAFLIVDGYPLNFEEYHLAVASHYLLADGIAYEEFYRKHWYEDKEKRGYGTPPRKARTPNLQT
jgi:hypothetical protein